MSELNFAKSFLGTLDNKTTKYQADHVFDPKTFQLRIPFTLPRLPNPPHPPPPQSSTAPPPPGSTSAKPTVTITLKSSRNPVLALVLPSLSASETTIARLRESIQSELGGPSVVSVEKIKILFNKKPIPTSKKTVADAIEGSDQEAANDKEVEFSVMVMGGAPDPPPKAETPAEPAPVAVPEAPTPTTLADKVAKESSTEPMEDIQQVTSLSPAQGPSGKEVLATAKFWDDLQGFLEQRLKDEGEAQSLRKLFEGAWKADT